MVQKENPPCDCLNWCGDDPRLQDGRAEWCQHERERQARETQRREYTDRLHALIDQLGATAQAQRLVTLEASLVAELQRLVQALVRR